MEQKYHCVDIHRHRKVMSMDKKPVIRFAIQAANGLIELLAALDDGENQPVRTRCLEQARHHAIYCAKALGQAMSTKDDK